MAHVNKEVHNMKKKSLILVAIVLIGYYFLSSHSTERKYQVLNEILMAPIEVYGYGIIL